MALTQDQWFTRLKRWVPYWFLAEEEHNIAILQGIAKLLAERSAEVDTLVANTFIETATTEWLQLIGHERSVDLMSGETLAQYRVRIRNSNTTAKLSDEDIENIVESLITSGTFWVRDDFHGSSFCDRSYFCNRRDVIFSMVKDGFTIFVDNQGNIDVLTGIIRAVNSVKAFGCLYRLIERIA
jgi:hypothetical protein